MRKILTPNIQQVVSHRLANVNVGASYHVAQQLHRKFALSGKCSSNGHFSDRDHLEQCLHTYSSLMSHQVTYDESVDSSASSSSETFDSPRFVTNVKPKYKRIMLKISGEALQGSQGFGVQPAVLQAVAEEIAEVVSHGVQVSVVVGGGNYFRGANAWTGLDRVSADHVGMLATVMNALMLQSALESLKVPTRVLTAIEMKELAEPYIRRRAISHLEAGRVVIFGAGIGNPFFTTDTAAALRAAEMNAEVFLKATKVDGVYDKDPQSDPAAVKYTQLSYRTALSDDLQVMDQTAVTLCKENKVPVVVFSLISPGNIVRASLGEPVGTVVCDGSDEASISAAQMEHKSDTDEGNSAQCIGMQIPDLVETRHSLGISNPNVVGGIENDAK